MSPRDPRPTVDPAPRWPGAVAWLLAGAAMAGLDGHVGLASLACLLILGAAFAALWWPAWLALPASVVAVLAFNVAFIEPRGSVLVDVRQDAVLLVAMLVVAALVGWLVARQRALVQSEAVHAARSAAMRAFAERLREAGDETSCADALRLQALGEVDGEACVLVAGGDPAGPHVVGEAGGDALAGLWLVLASGRALGPGSGLHEEQAAWYLPLPGRAGPVGALRLAWRGEMPPPDAARERIVALCEQAGPAIERARAMDAARAAREDARAEAVRSTLLAAISHDHRTPLAAILGAASALHDQAGRLSEPQVRRLAGRIVEESRQLVQLTENTLQLARLDMAPGSVARDWEAAEELVGELARRMRARGEGARLALRVTPGLPLVRVEAGLVVQLLENLVGNAMRHGGDGPVEVAARRLGGGLVLAVADRGPGLPPVVGERAFAPFQRGVDPSGPADGSGGDRRGAGLGLALCRVIAEVHAARFAYRPRRGGGACFVLLLPTPAPPAGPDTEAAAWA